MVLGVFGKQARFTDFNILPNVWVVRVQFIIAGIGTPAAPYATSKITSKDLKDLTPHNRSLQAITSIAVLALGLGLAALFFSMNSAE